MGLIDKEPKPLSSARRRARRNESLLTSASREIRVCRHQKGRKWCMVMRRVFCRCVVSLQTRGVLQLILSYGSVRSAIIKGRNLLRVSLCCGGLIFPDAGALLFLYFSLHLFTFRGPGLASEAAGVMVGISLSRAQQCVPLWSAATMTFSWSFSQPGLPL